MCVCEMFYKQGFSRNANSACNVGLELATEAAAPCIPDGAWLQMGLMGESYIKNLVKLEAYR